MDVAYQLLFFRHGEGAQSFGTKTTCAPLLTPPTTREETAINIAVACQLLWTEARMHRTVINLRGTGESETDEITQALEG